jgi:hypothetical protein
MLLDISAESGERNVILFQRDIMIFIIEIG